MASNRKPRKAHRPKRVFHSPIEYVFSGLRRMGGESLTDLNVKNHAAMFAIAQGNGTRETWDKLTGCINMAIVMSERGTGEQYRDDLIAGRDALASLGARYIKHGRFDFTGDELAAMNQAMAVHDAQLEASRIIDVERAYDEIERRLRSGINTVRVVGAAA